MSVMFWLVWLIVAYFIGISIGEFLLIGLVTGTALEYIRYRLAAHVVRSW